MCVSEKKDCLLPFCVSAVTLLLKLRLWKGHLERLFVTSTVQITHKCLHLFPYEYTLLNFSIHYPSITMYHVDNFHSKEVSQNISPLRVLRKDCTLNGFIKDLE